MTKEVCRVCELLDNDTTKKEGEFCKICDHFICNDCKPDLWRRGLAAAKEKLNGKR